LTRTWVPKGSRTRKIKQGQFIYSYIYGASCPKTGDSFGLILPSTNTDCMQTYIDALSKHIQKDRYIALIVDNAGWHTSKKLEVPDNIILIPLPPYSPELNPMEQVWQWMKHNYLSNICFDNYEDILDNLTKAWNAFANNIELVKSICKREWFNI
jgi:transposase